MQSTSILKRPIITEKTLRLAKMGLFTFEVDYHATKPLIAQDVQKSFSVNVIRVATMIIKGKKRRAGRKRIEIKQKGIKKAVVQLKGDQKINLFDVTG